MTSIDNSPAALALERITQVVGAAHVSAQKSQRMAYTRGTWPVELKRAQMGDWSLLPAAVVWPATAEEVSQILKIAGQEKQAVVPYGGGSGIVGGTSLAGAIILDMRRMNGIEVNPTNQTVAAGAGVIGSHLEEALNAQGYTCGHFPQSMNSACVGGLVATASIGTFSGRYGKMDDILVGLQAVLPNGEILDTGAMPRRSAGPNLSQLFVGSEGAFGIITRATLRIWPLPEVRRWAVYTFPDTPLGLEALREMMRTEAQPALVRLYDAAESAGRIKLFGYPAGHSLLILGFEGSQGYVDWQMSAAERLCLQHQAAPRGDEAALHWYRYRFDTSGMLRTNQKPGGAADALEVAAPWDRLEAVWRSMRRALEPLCDQVHCHFSHVYPTEGSVYVIFYAHAEEDTPQAAIDLYQRCLSGGDGGLPQRRRQHLAPSRHWARQTGLDG